MKNCVTFLCLILLTSLHAQNTDSLQYSLKLVINFNVFSQSKELKDILTLWEELLNQDLEDINAVNTKYWLKSENFFAPNLFLPNLTNFKKNIQHYQATVIKLEQIKPDTFLLKTMFSNTLNDKKKTQLGYIYSVYVVKTNQGFKFMSYPQWYFQKWEKRQVGSITYCFEKSHQFNEGLAAKLDSFNQKISNIFQSELQYPIYFVGNDFDQVLQLLGYDFDAVHGSVEGQGGYTNPTFKAIFAGNGTEYHAHEVVHLYLQKHKLFNIYSHRLTAEGIATLFGGYKGQSLEWNLKNLKKYIDQNPQESFNDISTYYTINNAYETDFAYEIGGLICKLVYEQEGINGLFDLLQIGSSDDNFYNAVQKYFKVKREDFGKFIKNELKNY